MTMKRVCLPLLAIVCLLLTGCAGREVEKAYAGFSERVNAAQSLTFTANVRAEYEHKTAKFTLSYTEDDSGGAVTVLAPELIAGVTARVEPGSTVLQYDGVVLDTGSLDSLGLSPMSSLPVLVQAMKSGHLDSYGEEDGLYVCRLEPNDEYRVDLIDYSEYNTEDDYNAGLTKLNTEIMAGNMPDILALDTQTPYRQYAAKGLLEDLYPYIDADSELDRSDYFPNVFAALEVNGGLYTACAGFGILSAVGATSIVGDTPGWTYDEYYEALAKMPEGCEGFDYGYDRNTLLTLCLALDMDDYMDWSTGECRFDSEDFVKLLEFANQNKTDFDYENSEYTEEDTAANRIREGKQMLTSANFFSADYMYNNFEQTFGAPVTIKGFPTMHGVGNMITILSSYAMGSTCQHKDAAWQFLRTFLTEDYQKDVPYLPTNMNVFEKQLADSMVVEYEKDPNGNYMLDENGERIPVSKGMISDGVNTYTIYATTQEQADQLRQAIADTTELMNYDMSIADIVTEQAAAYFSGQKSAEEVAKLIQSKANIYINEQR